jgi:hypothetical protein
VYDNMGPEMHNYIVIRACNLRDLLLCRQIIKFKLNTSPGSLHTVFTLKSFIITSDINGAKIDVIKNTY